MKKDRADRCRTLRYTIRSPGWHAHLIEEGGRRRNGTWLPQHLVRRYQRCLTEANRTFKA